MKKAFFIVFVFCTFLLAGCDKNYNTTTEYIDDMAKVRDTLGDYTIETEMTSEGMRRFYEMYAQAMKSRGQTVKVPEAVYYKMYKHGTKWKAETYTDKYRTENTVKKIFDGDNFYEYNSNISPYAQLVPLKNKTPLKLQRAQYIVNPNYLLFYWDRYAPFKFGEKTTKNNFKCRMITYDQGDEACINDKYGIAVYFKANNIPLNGDIELKVTSINNMHLSDTDVAMPQGIKKQPQ